MKKYITILLLLSATFSGISQNIGDKYWSDASLEKVKHLKMLMSPGKQNTEGVNIRYYRVNNFIDTVWRGYSMPYNRIDSIIGKDAIYSKWIISSSPLTITINAVSDSIYTAFKRQINTP